MVWIHFTLAPPHCRLQTLASARCRCTPTHFQLAFLWISLLAQNACLLDLALDARYYVLYDCRCIQLTFFTRSAWFLYYQHTSNKTWLDTMYFAAFVCVVPPAERAPLTVNIVCEEQTPSQTRIAAQAPSNPACLELRCGELEVESNSFGPLGIDPSLLQWMYV